MAQRPITTVTHFSTHGLREVVGRAVHDQREYSVYERLVSAGPKRAPSTLGNHEIPVRHACVADCALAAQSRLRTSRHPTARPRPSSRWSAFLRCFTPEKQRRPALRCPARGAVALRPSSGQRISPEPAFVLPAISPGRANRASNHRRCWPCSPLGFPSGFPVWGRPAGDPKAQSFADQDLAVAWLHHRSDAGVRGKDVPPLLAAVERAEVDDHLKCRPAPRQSARPLQRSRTRKTPRLTADRIRKRD